MTAELVTIASDLLTARINPMGAELWSLTDSDGREYMTDADPAFWTGHAPLLFPIVGSLHGGTYRLGDTSYELPRHGFARTRRFDCIEQNQGLVRFRLTDSPATRNAYPFAFVLEMAFRLEGWTLRMEATVANPGAELPSATTPPSPGRCPAVRRRKRIASPLPRTSRNRSVGSTVRPGWCCPTRGRARSRDGHLPRMRRCSRPTP